MDEKDWFKQFKDESRSLDDTFAWDEFDAVANAIIALVRTQNRIQGLHNAFAYHGDVPGRMFHEAFAAREKAIEQLLAIQEARKGRWWEW